jgi:hypothetical protein
MATKKSKSKKNSSVRQLASVYGKRHQNVRAIKQSARRKSGSISSNPILTKQASCKPPLTKSSAQILESMPGREYKEELLNSDKSAQGYDKLFEEKLASQYKAFRNFKENNLQMRRFLRLLSILLMIIILALLLLSFG